uniref:Uncharacterized protein n=1 Tax=Nelumbo nucifera TaxID=4432 RepID=A0A822Y913_NELNU|nr:TPA_asm: hypothetical protein HUJ06_009405 [Nelumbo nucifera]
MASWQLTNYCSYRKYNQPLKAVQAVINLLLKLYDYLKEDKLLELLLTAYMHSAVCNLQHFLVIKSWSKTINKCMSMRTSYS